MTKELIDLVSKEQEAYDQSNNPDKKLNILYNLIAIKNKYPNQRSKPNIYVDIKSLIGNYVELIKTNDFGYDFLCYKKILKVISFLSLNEQLAILNYLFSVISKEFPALNKEWIQDAIKTVKIKKIIKENKYWKLPQAFFLYSSLSFFKLVIALAFLILVVYIVLLPAPKPWMGIFKVSHVAYCDTFIFNHLFNVISLFGGINNRFEVIAINSFGLIVQIAGKILFLLLIVNFIYKKISDKISIK